MHVIHFAYFFFVSSSAICILIFRIPPDCHHEARTNHYCHSGDCPSCKQICNKERPTCPHLCSAPCHSAVLVKIQAQKASMPWEQTGPQIEKQCLACPDCKVPVSVTCLGKIFQWKNSIRIFFYFKANTKLRIGRVIIRNGQAAIDRAAEYYFARIILAKNPVIPSLTQPIAKK